MQNVRVIKIGYWWWVALVVAPLITLIFWACFGVIYVDATGQIIILPTPDKVEVVTSDYEGVLEHFNAKAAESVKKGQIIAVIRQNRMKLRLENAKKLLDVFKSRQVKLHEQYQQYLDFSKKYRSAAKELTDQKLSGLSKQKKYFEYLSKSEEDLYKQRLTSLPEFKKTQIELYRVLEGIFNATDHYNSVLLNHENTRVNWLQRLNSIDTQVDENQMKVDLLQYEYNKARYIKSPMKGVIDQILVPIGQNIHPGQSIASISSDGKAAYALAFLPVDKGKRININAKAYVSPGDVNKNIYGYIIGHVEHIEEYQSSTQALNAMIVNASLSEKLEREDLNFVAWIKLQKNVSTYSGFTWTSKSGPPYKITPGTLGTVNVVIDKIHPIELVLPFLRSLLNVGNTTK